MSQNHASFVGRTDAEHVLRQLPNMGGLDSAHPDMVAKVDCWHAMGSPLDFGGLMLLGPTGSGKTTVACHLVRFALARYEWATSCAFMLASDLAENDLLLETAKRVKLLVLDDIGKEHDPKSRIFRALDYRHTRVPTVITTGLNQDDLVNHYDSATLRRMAEFRGKQIPRISVFGAAQ